MQKFIFVTGGVLSSLGKGITAASIGALLESMGYTISFLKLDPYLNIDPGTMSPFQHGEVFVTDDGAETDLDLGHYERFTHVTLSKKNSATAGKLYAQLLDKERRGDFLGGTIQTVPHFTNEIQDAIFQASANAQITLVEIGGTVGDIEGLPFIEAIRQIGLKLGREQVLFVHVTYVPYLQVAGELKTKPTQHAVKALLSLGVQPDILICRAPFALAAEVKKKIALFTNVAPEAIISAADLPLVYDLPIALAQQDLPAVISQKLGLPNVTLNLKKWQDLSLLLRSLRDEVHIAIVGKYTGLKDAYKSLCEALVHAQMPTMTKVVIDWVNAEELTEENVAVRLQDADGILIPGGFGGRGTEGKIEAVRFARLKKIPFLGICLGMQIAVIEFARNVLGLSQANSTEFDPNTPDPVVDMMESQKEVTSKGGTMRLGAQVCKLVPGLEAAQIYGVTKIFERHRHRYEFNTAYAKSCEEHGLHISGVHETQNLPEIIELRDHPFFIACQFHPELKSRLFNPHPLFVAFVAAAKKRAFGA